MIDNFNSNVNPEKKEYKTITPFKMFIKGYFPFIEDTMEAIDNYGLLSKIVEYLNNLISNENTTVDNIDSLYTAFSELQTNINNEFNNVIIPSINEKIEYIDNYFENLDVQTEINNKLDEMVENGTMTDLISPYINNVILPLIEVQNTNINVLGNRVNQLSSLTEGSTTGDAELEDIRIGFDGFISTNAGNSVRHEDNLINEKIKKLNNGDNIPNNQYFSFSRGDVLFYPEQAANDRVHTIKMNNPLNRFKVFFDVTKYRLVTIYYDESNNIINSAWQSNSPFINNNLTYPYFYLQLKKINGSNFTDHDIIDVNNTCYIEDTIINNLELKKNNILYVNGANGNDLNSGSENSPLKTIQHAIDLNPNIIYVDTISASYNEELILDGVNNLKISPIMPNSFNNSIQDTPKIIVSLNYNGNTAMTCTNCNNLIFESCEFRYTKQSIVYMKDCSNIKMTDCIFRSNLPNVTPSKTYDGLKLENVTGEFYNCIAHDIDRDGFNIHDYGNTSFINCVAYNCGDDGISHHDGCTGIILGGEFYNCGKGGVSSPTHGSHIDVTGVYSHDNHYGLYAMTTDETIRRRVKGIIRNCVFKNNSVFDIAIVSGDLIGIENIYDTKSVNITTQSTFTEFN